MIDHYKEYSLAYISVDCIVFGFDNGKLKMLLGRRQINPGRGEWALYGGFVSATENLENAAERVLTSLTGLKNIFMRQVGAYGAVNRDPESRVISVAYCALINVKDYDEELRKQYGLEWVSLEEIPPLFSDHSNMVEDALIMLRRRISNEPICFSLLPELFTLTQLQNVFEAIVGKEIDKRNFRKRAKQSNVIEETNIIDKLTSKRGAVMYRYNGNETDFRL